MLTVEIYDKVSGVTAFPVYLDGQVIVSWVELDSDGAVSVAVDEITDVLAELIGDFIDFKDDQSDKRVLIALWVFSMILLYEGDESFSSVGGSKEDSFEGTM